MNNTPKISIDSVDIPQISLFRSSQYGSVFSLAPGKLPTHGSIYQGDSSSPSRKDSRKESANVKFFEGMDESRIRTSSFKKGRTTKQSILMMQNKRTSSISMNFRKPSFLFDLDENKNKKKIMDILDIYTQEQLISTAIKILQKPKTHRSGTDVRMLMKCTERVGFFAEMIANQETDKHEECCKAMGYKLAIPGEVIVMEGTIGNTFYIILKGVVGIYKAPINELASSSSFKEFEVPNQTKLSKKSSMPQKNQTQNIRRLSTKAKENIEIVNAANSINTHQENLTKIKVLKAGEAFGELSLMENKPRAATVICEQEECHLAILEKQYFDKILKEMEKKKLFKQIDFFSSLKLFSSWSYNAVKNLYYLSSQVEFKKLMAVYKENDSAEEVFIIKSGEFKVLKKVGNETLDLNSSIMMHRGNKTKDRKMEICLLGPGEAFGEEEVIEQIPRRNTVVCNSISGVLFVIERKEFLKRVLISQKAKKQLEEQINSKSEWRERRIEEKLERFKTGKQGFIDMGFSETNIDPEQFAMIKGQLHREKDVITNIKETYLDPLMMMIDKPKREKGKMIPVMENIIDPSSLINSLKDKPLLRQMTANSPKRNFFILTNMFRQEKRKEEVQNHSKQSKNKRNKNFSTNKSDKKSKVESLQHLQMTEETPRCQTLQNQVMQTIMSNNSTNQNLKINEESSQFPKFSSQIVLPMSNNSINNYLRLKTVFSENEYQLNINTPKPSGERIKKVKKDSSPFKETPLEFLIKGRGSSCSEKEISLLSQRKKIPFDSLYDMKFLPLKYSSEQIKRKAHTPSLSLSAMMRKNSRGENDFEEEFFTSRQY